MLNPYFRTSLFALMAFCIATTAKTQTNPNPNPALDSFILDEMDIERFPGLSAVIVKDDKIVWIASYGMADIENAVPVSDSTVFLLASVSKLFTGTAAMQLVENNLFSLNDNVNTFLPWNLQIPAFPSNPVTFKQLMTHSSSIQDNFAVMDTYYDYPDPTITLADCMQRYFSTEGQDYNPTANFLSAAPGTVFEYSNMATALNGYLVELISGMPFDEYCNNHIFNNLCMNKTSWYFSGFNPNDVALPYQYNGSNYVAYPHYGFADYPDGQLRSNVIDMANFMIAYLNDGNFGSQSILMPENINQMLSQQIPGIDSSQGLNWYRELLYHSNGTAWLWGHNGGEQGASTDLYIDTENKIGICVLTNGEGDALYICDELYDYALGLDPQTGFAPECLITHVAEITQPAAERKLIKIIDYTGRETQLKPNTPLIKMYSDGSVERIYLVE